MKKLIATVIVIASTVLMQGCATGYGSKDLTGGLSVTQIDDAIYNISFQGNGYTSTERATNYTLLKASELALAGGYKYFVIKGNVGSSTSYHTTPVVANTNYGYGNSNTVVYGGNSYAVNRPNVTATAVLLNQKVDGIMNYNARLIYDGLTKKYKVKPKY